MKYLIVLLALAFAPLASAFNFHNVHVHSFGTNVQTTSIDEGAFAQSDAGVTGEAGSLSIGNGAAINESYAETGNVSTSDVNAVPGTLDIDTTSFSGIEQGNYSESAGSAGAGGDTDGYADGYSDGFATETVTLTPFHLF